MSAEFFTIGHSTNTLDEFIEFLHHAQVNLVVDVRKLTGSRKFPQFNDDSLAVALPGAAIQYRQNPHLAGRRRKSVTVPPKVNGNWRNQSFHNYADHTLTEEFQEGLAALRSWGEDARVAVMCSEAVWWRCHRRLIADQLLGRGEQVFHIIGHQVQPATFTPGAVVAADGQVTYPAS